MLTFLHMNGLHLPEREVNFKPVIADIFLDLLFHSAKPNSNKHRSFLIYLTWR